MVDFKKVLEEFKDKEAELVAKSKPFRDRLSKLADKIAPYEKEMKEIHLKIKEIEQPFLGEVRNQIAKIEKILS